MPRLMIAEDTGFLAEALEEILKSEFDVNVCKNGNMIINTFRDFLPDIMLIDLDAVGANIYSILRAIHMSGKQMKVIALTSIVNEFVLASLQNSGVYNVLTKPCCASMAAIYVRNAYAQAEGTHQENYCPENELDGLLLELGFRMGPSRYLSVFEAVLYKYYHPKSAMKELYIEVAHICGGTQGGTEKAIRDAVEDAYKHANGQAWDLLFPYSRNKERPYPSNEDFVARIANCLTQKRRSFGWDFRI